MESRAWCLCDRGIRINLCRFYDLSVLCTDHVLDDDLVDHRTERSTHPRHQTHHQADLQNKGTAAIHEEIIPDLILRVNISLKQQVRWDRGVCPTRPWCAPWAWQTV